MPRPSDPHPFRVTIVRYATPDGKRCRSTDPGAVKTVTTSQSYYADLTVDGRRKRYPLGTCDEGVAWVKLRALQRRLRDREHGITDDTSDHLARPLADHLDDWLAVEAAKGTQAKQLHMLRHDVETLAAIAGWGRLGDLTADSAARALGHLQHQLGRSAQTRNHYHAHLRQFTRWCAEGSPPRLRADPLRSLRKVSVEGDRRHDRRCPSDNEVALLFAYLAGPAAPVRCRMTGPQRALGYKVAMAAGLRAEELRGLTAEGFDLAEGTVTVTAAYDKAGKQAIQGLPAWLVAELREWFGAGGGLWEGFPASHPGRLLKADLAAAGVPYRVETPDGPLFFDFHALRHYYCTQIANQPGISPKVMMVLCRHSTPALTLKVYAKVRDRDELRAAVEQIGPIGTPPPPPPQPPSDPPPPPE